MLVASHGHKKIPLLSKTGFESLMNDWRSLYAIMQLCHGGFNYVDLAVQLIESNLAVF